VLVGVHPLCAFSSIECQINFLPFTDGYDVVYNGVKIAAIETRNRKKILIYDDCEFVCRLTRKRNIDSQELGIRTKSSGFWLKLVSEKIQNSPICDIALFAVCLDLWYDCYFN